MWVDMKETGVDAILSAPQKGWTGPACSSVIMLGERGTHATRNTTSTSMVINMRKWLEVMDSYVNGGFAYYTTMPTDALSLFNGAANETKKIGFEKVKQMAWDLGMGTKDDGIERLEIRRRAWFPSARRGRFLHSGTEHV